VNFRPNFNSITTRLIIFGFAILIAGALGRILFLGEYLRKDITELTTTQLLTLANYVAHDVDHNLIERRELLQRVAAKFPASLLHDRKEMQDWLKERHELNPLFTFGMSVLDTSGKIIAGYPASPQQATISFADRDYFRQAMQGSFAVGSPVVGRIAGVPVLPMALPLRDGSGKVLAVLTGATALDEPDFLDSLQQTHIGNTGGVLLISPKDKMFVGASDLRMIFKPTPAKGINALHDRAMEGFRGTGVTVNAFGVEELVGIASVPSSGWFVVTRLPTTEAYAPITRLRNFVISNTVLISLFFFVIIVIGLRYLLNPLRNAAEYADRMTLGELPLEPLPIVRDDEVGHLTASFNRVLSKLLESRAELDHMAHHDTLTGLPNRQLLEDRMKQAVARAQRGKGKIAALFLDLDGFKPINDGLGHEAGDAALCQVTERLKSIVRQEDTLARVGGDEFVIVLSDLEGNAAEAAELVARKCVDIFQQPFFINGHSCRLGTSIGIALGDHNCVPHKLLIAADQAMYRAKDAGRGRFAWANECLDCLATGGQADCSVKISIHKSVAQ
jgi:diguanylate cyclase (GGDEF)-like protein